MLALLIKGHGKTPSRNMALYFTVDKIDKFGGNIWRIVMFKTLITVAIAAILISGLSAVGAKAAVKSQTINYEVGNKFFSGYLAYYNANSCKRPGVIVVHEWWGHDAYARKRAICLQSKDILPSRSICTVPGN